MLRHYDKGPCRNKLGHSRASLFFHRTQVIKKSTAACIIYWTYLPPIMLGVLLIDSEMKVLFPSFRHCLMYQLSFLLCNAMHSAFNRREVSSEVHALQYCRIPFSFFKRCQSNFHNLCAFKLVVGAILWSKRFFLPVLQFSPLPQNQQSVRCRTSLKTSFV